MATAFTAFGKGNGFPCCLDEINLPSGGIILNPPSLAQTMNAYWNFKSASFGGATLDLGNQPKDLICNETLNVGSASYGNPGTVAGRYQVRNALPRIFTENGVKYYRHGIYMNFYAQRNTNNGNGAQFSSIDVTYISAYYFPANVEPYSCVDITFGEPPEDEVIGREADSITETVSSVTISGIPFIKKVKKVFSGQVYAVEGSDGKLGPVPPCPTRNAPNDPGLPTLTLHTY